MRRSDSWRLEVFALRLNTNLLLCPPSFWRRANAQNVSYRFFSIALVNFEFITKRWTIHAGAVHPVLFRAGHTLFQLALVRLISGINPACLLLIVRELFEQCWGESVPGAFEPGAAAVCHADQPSALVQQPTQGRQWRRKSHRHLTRHWMWVHRADTLSVDLSAKPAAVCSGSFFY